jgi:7,8-dihydropterin-6-yl-methyl-4-(beta-D-ribofuranosyl)aminobenzene 5'-phosphate synthase
MLLAITWRCMNMDTLGLREAERLEVTVLVDNYHDAFVPPTDVAQRLLSPPPNLPLAEHGFACLLKAHIDSEEHTILFDTGASSTCFFHNAKLLNIDFSKIESVVLSHGHFDHFGALVQFLDIAKSGTMLVLHPDAFLERRINIPAMGIQVGMGMLSETDLQKTGMMIQKVSSVSTLAAGLVMVTGEVERVTDFEKGFPWVEAKINNEWVLDPLRDDQGIAVKVKGKGLVVVGGCSHAGIINTVKYAQKVTGTEKVHAVLGGFHLTGPLFDPIINPTIQEMKKIGPEIIVPMHCTGWKAINQFSEQMPEQFILNSVGTTYVFQ